MNPLDIDVSYYPGGVLDTLSTATVNLYEQLTQPTPEQIAEVQAVRNCTDPVKQKALKNKVGGFTPSGVFSPPRSDANLVKHSGIITLDVDREKNQGLDFAGFRARVQLLDWVAACMLSIRGAGLAIYVPIEEPGRHRDHFRSLAADFAEMGVTLDPTCINESRLRFNSIDPETYINTGCTRYKGLIAAPTTSTTGLRRVNYKATATPSDLFSWAASLVEKDGVTFADGAKHEFITRFSEILNRYGVPEAQVWDHVSAHYIPRSEIRSNCISGPYRKYADEHGTRSFRPSQSAARPRTNLHFPKRSIKPNPAADISPSRPEPEWQDVPSFDWQSSTTGTALSITETHLKHEDNIGGLHAVEAPLHVKPPLRPEHLPAPEAVPNIALCEATNYPATRNIAPLPINEEQPTLQGRKTKAALLSQDRKLFIETPPLNQTFTVYSSVEAYNSRSEVPQFITKDAVIGQPFTVVLIDLEALKIDELHALGQG